MKDKERLDLFDILIGIVLVSVILLSPLPFGSVAPWAKSAIFVLALLMAALWLLQSARRGRILLCRSPLWFILPAVAVCVGLQLLPMAPGLLKAVSPGTAGLYEKTLAGWPASGEAKTLSLAPHSTVSMLCHFGALALILIVVMNSVRTRGQVVAVILALTAVGTFEVLYGFAEQFSGHHHIFWNERMFHLPAVAGTFHNKNHFAGLLEMIVPVVLGLFIAISPKPSRSPLMRTKFLHTVSAAGTYRQLMLGVCLVLLITGIFFSLSRAGILCAVCSWAGFAVVLSMTTGFRKYTLALLLIVLVTLSLAIAMGAGMVIDGIEDAASGKATSWADRLDLWESSLSLFETFPLLGTGLGAFAPAFERFQSMRFGDRYADYLHNDWLQLFCEMGLIGGMIIILGFLFMMVRLSRKTFARRDSFCRWVGLGAMTGTFAMLLHSVFDYNLYKITSNGVLFVVILGLWHAAANLPHRGESPGRKYLELPIPSPGLRWVGACMLVCLLFPPALWSIRKGMADIQLNRFLACSEFRGKVEDYHFLPAASEDVESPEACIEAARRLDPANPRYAFYEALNELKGAEQKIRDQARATAKSLLGTEVESSDPAGFQQVAVAIEQSLKQRMAGVCGPSLEKTERLLREAIALSPGTAHLHLNLASVIAQLGAPLDAIHEARVALWLSPTKPSVLFEAGQIFADGGFASSSEREKQVALDFAAACFKNALRADPDYADRIYAIVQTAMGGKEGLMNVTPMTASGYEKLIERLWAAGQWEDVLSCLDAATRLVGTETVEQVKGRGSFTELKEIEHRFEPQDISPEKMKEILCSISRRRCRVLSLLGKWMERGKEVSRYNRLLRDNTVKMIRKAQALRKDGRYVESFSLFLDVIRQDWRNQTALIAAADLSSLPRTIDLAPPYNGPLDILFRLVLNNEPIKEDALAKTMEILDELRLEKGEDLLLADLIRGAALILGERTENGLGVLENLAPRAEETGGAWRQRHLVWYFLGQGYESAGKPERAVKAYRRVLIDVPTHLKTLEKLADLESRDRVPVEPDDGKGNVRSVLEPLKALTPSIPCRVSFGGKVELLGLDLTKEKSFETDHEATWHLTYYWMFRDRIPEGYHPLVHFCDENGRTLFQDDHRPKLMNRPYPVDLPRSGEVVVEKRRLSDDPTNSHFLRIGISSASPVRSGPKHLTSDGGDWFFMTRSKLLQNEGV